MGYVDLNRSAKYGREYFDRHFILLRSSEPDKLKRFYERRFAFFQAYYAEKRSWQSTGEPVTRDQIRLLAMSQKVIGHENDQIATEGEPDEIMFIDRERLIIDAINPKSLLPDQRVRLKAYHTHVLNKLKHIPHGDTYRFRHRIMNTSIEEWYDFQTLMGLLKGQRLQDIPEILLELTEQNLSQVDDPVVIVRLKKFKEYVNKMCNQPLPQTVADKIELDTYQEFMEEMMNQLEPWQYAEPYELEFKERFELDIEAYKTKYFPNGYTGVNKYSQGDLVKRLVKNLADCKHPYWISYRNYLLQLSQPIVTKAGKTKSTDAPEHLIELFPDKEMFQDCIDVLKKVNPPILNEKGEYIGNLKSAICVWVSVMQRKSLIKRVNDDTYAKLISDHIANYSIEKSTFGKENPRAHNRYQLDMQTLLSKVSQERK